MKLIIEIDGSQHFTEEGKRKDALRTEILEKYGLTVIRIANNEIFKNVLDKFLNEIICNDELKTIGYAAFAGCSNLSRVKFNGSLQIIEDKAFQNCDFDFIVIPKSVQKIGEEVFTSGNIFCEAESKPEGWHDGFYTGTAKVYYKGQWDYDNEGNPYVVNIDE